MQHSYDELDRKDTVPRGTTHWKAMLNEEEVLAIRDDNRMSSRDLAKKYGVSYTTIRSIKTGSSWKHLLKE